MAMHRLCYAPGRAETLFYNANLLRNRLAPAAADIGDRQDLDLGSASMVGHNVGSKRKSSAQKDGPWRGLTIHQLRA